MNPAPPGDERAAREKEEPPPILGSWRRLYALVALLLGLEILFCAWLSRLGR